MCVWVLYHKYLLASLHRILAKSMEQEASSIQLSVANYLHVITGTEMPAQTACITQLLSYEIYQQPHFSS